MKVASNTAKLLQHVPLPDEIGEVRTNTAVIDIGSYLTRVGFSGDNYPRLLECTNDLLYTNSHSSLNGSADNYGSKDRCDASRVNVNTLNENINNKKDSNNSNRSYSNEFDDLSNMQLMHNGNIVDWDKYEELMCKLDDILCFSKRSANSIFSQSLYTTTLPTPSSPPCAMHEMPLLFTEKALVTHTQRERVAQMLFETFDAPKIQFALSPSLSLYAAGLSTGVGLEMGHEQCHVVPVFQGISWFHAIHTFPFGGAHLTQLFKHNVLQHSLITNNETGLSDNNIINNRVDGNSRSNTTMNYNNSSSSYHVENTKWVAVSTAASWTAMKERYCCVANAQELYLNLEENADASNVYKTCTHTLPDGTTLTLDSISTLCAEALFTPELFTSSLNLSKMQKKGAHLYESMESVVQLPTSLNANSGIHELLVDAIQKCDADIIPELYENIVLSGGTSMTRNLPSRLKREVQLLLSTSSPSLPSSACVSSHAPASSSLASSTMQHINTNVAETVNVHATPERQHASFVGASILASLPTFEHMWITKAEYDEHGSKAVRMKCLDE